MKYTIENLYITITIIEIKQNKYKLNNKYYFPLINL